MTTTLVPVRLHWHGWLTPDRLAALPGSRQGFTARFDADAGGPTFSVVVAVPAVATATDPTDAGLELLAPDLLPDVAAGLTPGRRLTLFSGPREVAGCEILPTRP